VYPIKKENYPSYIIVLPKGVIKKSGKFYVQKGDYSKNIDATFMNFIIYMMMLLLRNIFLKFEQTPSKNKNKRAMMALRSLTCI
jgi:hypothetical protein